MTKKRQAIGLIVGFGLIVGGAAVIFGPRPCNVEPPDDDPNAGRYQTEPAAAAKPDVGAL